MYAREAGETHEREMLGRAPPLTDRPHMPSHAAGGLHLHLPNSLLSPLL